MLRVTSTPSRLILSLVWPLMLFAMAALFTAPQLAYARLVPGYYIVELSEDPPAEKAASEPSLERRRQVTRERRDVVAAEQRTLRRILAREGAVPFEALDTVANALLVQMPEETAAKCTRFPGVRRVYPVREVEVKLERALPIHRVPEGWSQIGGGDRAGEGVKIAIVDSGIDASHPGFVDPSIPMPEGFPRVNRPSDLPFTSNKVIVARNYLAVLDQGSNANDVNGHGSAVAMAAAGVVKATADGPISGVAPKAWLGNYKVVRPSGSARTDLMLKAIDDAVRDGMDVINLSLGSSIALRPEDEILVRMMDRATALGVLVVVAAGNEGNGRFSLGDTAVPYSAISVGATWNSRTIDAKFALDGVEDYRAIPSDGPKPVFPITAPVLDVALLDSDGLACSPLPANSLSGRIAVILRGSCFFEEKLNHAQAAGALAAVVYTHEIEPQPIIMAVGGATLPAVMVSYDNGLEIKQTLAGAPGLTGTVNFRVTVEVDPDRLAGFSSRGPNTDLTIKPDIVATGMALNTATLDNSFDLTQGTSFSAPIVAGAAAVLKANRPGLSAHHYRSLLINAAEPLPQNGGGVVPVQEAGGGRLDLDRSLQSTVAAYPTAVSFGDTTEGLNRRLTITNLGTASDTFTVSAQPFDSAAPPLLSASMMVIPPGEAKTVTVSISPNGLPSGEYQGFLRVSGTLPGSDMHVPYWYGIRSNEPAYLNIVRSDETGGAGQLLRGGLAIRVTDAAGIPITAITPTVTVVSGGGGVVSVFPADSRSPGLFEATLRLGSSPGNNVFRVEAGGLSKEVSIEGQ